MAEKAASASAKLVAKQAAVRWRTGDEAGTGRSGL
jgi:hypothetical protein